MLARAMTLVVLLAGTSVWGSDPYFTVRYDSNREGLLILMKNTCQDVEIRNDRLCTRSYPGQTRLAILKKDRAEGEPCDRSMIQFAFVPASELGCRPALVTVTGPEGNAATVEVPAGSERE